MNTRIQNAKNIFCSEQIDKGLLGFDVDVFLREHWQKRPLLLRGALPEFTGFLSVDEVLAQCERSETPARFRSEKEGMLSGPFQLDLNVLPADGWTVLVQSLETVFDEAWNLLDLFSFLPRARLDDVMVSYARPNGGIGPHFDLYDVFLIQGEGRRRWRYSDAPLPEDAKEEASGHFPFTPDHDVILEPGDILYLPPRVPHEGSSILPSMTYSIGAAAPRHEDIMGEFLAFCSGEPETVGLDIEGMYTDPDAEVPTQRGKVPVRLRDETLKRLKELRFDEDIVAAFLGRLLTAPRPHTEFPIDDDVALELEELSEKDLELHEEESLATLTQEIQKPGMLKLLPPSRMLHDGDTQIFMNGDAFVVENAECFLKLADERQVELPISLNRDEVEIVQFWMAEGFVVIESHSMTT
ncbi:MAG: hypothetical protein GY822_23480 [Deltaproteobacteria bacterium]|nr:hypothetical protein [Deltaproteobacteria bacterium]